MHIKDYMSAVSRWRSHIMGFCTLAVIVYHSELRFSSGPLSYLTNLLWEIDIFFFLTGMGVYHSLCRDSRVLPYYKRRFMRIYPHYLPVIILYFLPVFILYTDGSNLALRMKEFIGNVTMLGWFLKLDNQFNWYVPAVMVFYLVSPLVVYLVRRCEGRALPMAGLLALLCLVQPLFFGSGKLIAISRAIAFVMGIAASALAERGAKLKMSVPVMLLLFVVGNLINYYVNTLPVELSMHYGICWYPAVLVVPGMLFMLCWFYDKCGKIPALGWINRMFELMGRYSLEGYLVNVLIYDVIARCRIEIGSNFNWCLVMPGICVLSVLYGKLMEKVLKKA